VLSVHNLSVSIASVQILRDVSLAVPAGSMTGLIGRNGAGKTTLMKTVMGLLNASHGAVIIDSRDLTKMPTHDRARLGIGYMPEDRRLIPDLTVEENVLVPAWAAGIADAPARLEKIYGWIPEVRDFAPRTGLQLPGGPPQLAALMRFCSRRRVPWFVLGSGSNLLVGDGGMRGLVLRLGGTFAAIDVRIEGDRVVVEAGASAGMSLMTAKAASLGALEIGSLSGIPGTVGGSLRMNAGSDREMGHFAREVWVQSPAKPEPSAINVQYFYRHTTLARDAVVSRVVGQQVTDTTSGFQALNRQGIALFAGDYPHDYPEVEATVMVFRHRLRLQEVPVSMRERGGGNQRQQRDDDSRERVHVPARVLGRMPGRVKPIQGLVIQQGKQGGDHGDAGQREPAKPVTGPEGDELRPDHDQDQHLALPWVGEARHQPEDGRDPREATLDPRAVV